MNEISNTYSIKMLYYLSSQSMTVLVETNSNEIIIDTPPIVRKFLKQPIKNLINCIRYQYT